MRHENFSRVKDALKFLERMFRGYFFEKPVSRAGESSTSNPGLFSFQDRDFRRDEFYHGLSLIVWEGRFFFIWLLLIQLLFFGHSSGTSKMEVVSKALRPFSPTNNIFSFFFFPKKCYAFF